MPDLTGAAAYAPFPLAELVGTHDLVWITLDSLRFDVAQSAHERGETPNLSGAFPHGWERRHAPGTFTLASHSAMFAGFLPTPVDRPKAPRLAAARMPGTDALWHGTFVFDEATLPEALSARDYRTVCIGGVGFFSGRNAVGSALPALFQRATWKPSFGPGRPEAVAGQVRAALDALVSDRGDGPVFLFMNVAATHHPTHRFLAGATVDSVDTQRAALSHADGQLAPLLDAVRGRRSALIVCADHGDAFGEDGYWGHRHAHPTVLDVPYAHRVFDGASDDG